MNPSSRSVFALRACWLAVLISYLLAASSLAAVRDLLLVDNFETGVTNAIDGMQGRFQSGASKIDTLRDTTFFHGGQRGTSLRVKADKKENGFCGVYFHFHNSKAVQKKFFNAKPYGYLSFWVRGQSGGEQFTIKMSDRSWVAKDDTKEIGDVRKFLPNGISRNWQEVLVPLDGKLAIDLEELGGLTLVFPTLGQTTIYIDDICFKTRAEATLNPSVPENQERQMVRHAAPRTMWLWKLGDFLGNETAREGLFDLCAQEGIEQLWVQVNYKVDPLSIGLASSTGKPTPARVELKNEVWLREFLSAAHKARLQIHALDGDPEFAVRSKHSIPLGLVEAIIAFNQVSSPDQRFDGIHFDNEPYALLGWVDRTRREKMLKEMLELNVECQRRVRSQSGLSFGIDLPFWLHHIDSTTGRPTGEVTFNGKKKPASHHCIDLLDNVGVMNYRDSADGPDGMVIHGQDLLHYADNTKGARVFMGVETQLATPHDTWFVVGLPRKRFEAVLKNQAREFADLCRFNGFRLRKLDDGQNIHVGLEVPVASSAEEFTRFQTSLRTLAEKFGATSGTHSNGSLSLLRTAAESAVRVDPELGNFRNRDLHNGTGAEIPGFLVTSEMLPKITFGDNSYETFHEQVQSAENTFRQFKTFGGMAVHSYESFQLLIRSSNLASSR